MTWEAYSGNPVLAATAISDARSGAEAAKASAGAASMALIDAKRQNKHLEEELFEAKKIVHGQVALRESLKAALQDIAPDHPLNKSDVREKIVADAKAKTKPDDPWFPS